MDDMNDDLDTQINAEMVMVDDADVLDIRIRGCCVDDGVNGTIVTPPPRQSEMIEDERLAAQSIDSHDWGTHNRA